MRVRFKPRTSTDLLWTNFSSLDILWGIVAPVAALWLRDPGSFAPDRLQDSATYVLFGAVFTTLSFLFFRLSHTVSRFFSLADAVTVIKAGALAVAATALAGFIITRLDNIPRSVPLIHLMVLVAGNLGGRAHRHLRRRRRRITQMVAGPAENILVVGVSDAAWYYMQIVEELGAGSHQVVAFVDDSRRLQGRFVHGHPIAGRVEDIDKVLDEYRVHGVEIHRIVLAVEPDELAETSASILFRTAEKRSLPLEVLPERLGVAHVTAPIPVENEIDMTALVAAQEHGYWRVKRMIDVAVAGTALAVAAPVALCVAALVLVDCGLPVMFWQVRVGRYGQKITVFKFRTFKAPYDRHGSFVPLEHRLSKAGKILRRLHLDELPQLLSVLAGDMALVGPRPLLPVDLPKRVGLRLAVAPGMTGWAQVNGATLLTVDEKNAMDEWYVRHISWQLDARILFGTVHMLLTGARRNEEAIRTALAERDCPPTSAAA